MIHSKIHLIRPGSLRPSIALIVQNLGLKHQSFIHSNSFEKYIDSKNLMESWYFTHCALDWLFFPPVLKASTELFTLLTQSCITFTSSHFLYSLNWAFGILYIQTPTGVILQIVLPNFITMLDTTILRIHILQSLYSISYHLELRLR